MRFKKMKSIMLITSLVIATLAVTGCGVKDDFNRRMDIDRTDKIASTHETTNYII